MIRVIKYFPIISTLLIFMGFLKLYFYYDFFEISIIEYINISEILTSFLDEIILLGSLFVTILIMTYFTSWLYPKTIKKIDEEKSDVVYTALKIRYKSWKRVILISFGQSIFVMIGVLVFFKLNQLVGLVIISFYSLNILSMISIYAKKEVLNEGKMLAFILTIIISTTFLKAKKEAVEIQSKIHKKNIVLTESEQFVLTENDYIIGKTNNYIFLSVSNNVVILPEREIKLIKYINDN